MHILVAAIGKMKRGPAEELAADYLKRTRWDIRIKELPDAPSNLAASARRAREGESILALLDKETRLIALDSHGTQMTSEAFNGLLQKQLAGGAKKILLAIGGQDGLDEAVRARATATLAFGQMTWPHQLVRLMLAEQLYRAYTISIGHPYHVGH